MVSVLDNSADPFCDMALPNEIWPNLTDNETVNALFTKRVNPANESGAFAIGGWSHLFMALLNPDRYPSTLLVLENPDFAKSSRMIVAAGKILQQSSLLHPKYQIAQALFTLITRMKNDKDAGRSPVDCGWVACDELWPQRRRSTKQDARTRLTFLSEPLGQLDYIKGSRPDHPHCGQVRLPPCWAFPDAVIHVFS